MKSHCTLSDVEIVDYLVWIIKSHQPLFILDNNIYFLSEPGTFKKHAVFSNYEKRKDL